jgi:XapX domain-containing protein
MLSTGWRPLRGARYRSTTRSKNPILPEHVQTMITYFLSIGAGILIGVMYALFKVRSPAPPGIALIGLLGMVLGEPLLPLLHHWLAT